MADTPPPWADEPVANVQWVPLAKVEANAYNPNTVAANELRLLHLSISEDGFTQPIVTFYDKDRDRYIVVDGFHRYLSLVRHADIRARTGGHVPVVVIDKPLEKRMASTVRHNRARGKHRVTGMAQVVFGMLDAGMTDEEICVALGMEADELVRLKYVTGFAKLFENVEYRRAWETRRQIKIRQRHRQREAERETA
jgi:ParB-like chromosome segregation protein Spo0J